MSTTVILLILLECQPSSVILPFFPKYVHHKAAIFACWTSALLHPILLLTCCLASVQGYSVWSLESVMILWKDTRECGGDVEGLYKKTSTDGRLSIIQTRPVAPQLILIFSRSYYHGPYVVCTCLSEDMSDTISSSSLTMFPSGAHLFIYPISRLKGFLINIVFIIKASLLIVS